MTNSTLTTIARRSLPALSGCSVSYNREKNMFLTQGYTSAAGNTYFKAMRISDRLVVVYEVGEGYKYTFLNGITLYCWDGHTPRLIGRRQWGGCDDYRVYSDEFARQQSVEMLKDYLTSQLKLSGSWVNASQVRNYAAMLIAETVTKQLA